MQGSVGNNSKTRKQRRAAAQKAHLARVDAEEKAKVEDQLRKLNQDVSVDGKAPRFPATPQQDHGEGPPSEPQVTEEQQQVPQESTHGFKGGKGKSNASQLEPDDMSKEDQQSVAASTFRNRGGKAKGKDESQREPDAMNKAFPAGPVPMGSSGYKDPQELQTKAKMPSPPESAAGTAVKHGLQRRWCLWVHQRPGASKDKARVVHSFDTGEDFWCMVHHAYPPSKFENVDYSLFKQGVAPDWEDAAFKNGGGRWVINVEKVEAQSLDALWQSVNLALIGEAFYDHGPEVVCGAMASVRNRSGKIALWLSTAKDEKTVMAIGHAYRNVLASTPGLQEFATKELTFEDFKKQSMTYILPKTPGETTPVPPPPAPTQAGQFQ